MENHIVVKQNIGRSPTIRIFDWQTLTGTKLLLELYFTSNVWKCYIILNKVIHNREEVSEKSTLISLNCPNGLKWSNRRETIFDMLCYCFLMVPLTTNIVNSLSFNFDLIKSSISWSAKNKPKLHIPELLEDCDLEMRINSNVSNFSLFILIAYEH